MKNDVEWQEGRKKFLCRQVILGNDNSYFGPKLLHSAKIASYYADGSGIIHQLSVIHSKCNRIIVWNARSLLLKSTVN